MKLAITADWLPVYGGAEHVLWQMHCIWPDAPIYTTICKPSAIGPLQAATIHTTYLQKAYSLINNHQILLPFMPKAIESIDLTGYDIVLSSSHAVGKGVIPPSNAVHICYCHTPMRYAWEMEDQYLEDFKVPKILRPLVRHQLQKLRDWDLTTAKRTDYFIANSSETAKRIKRIYGRESEILLPPVDDKFFTHDLDQFGTPTEPYFLALGRLVPYKKFDLLIEVANELELPLVIAGTGREEQRLKSMAGPTVTFLGYVDDTELTKLYTQATALLFPQLEDAGVTPLEAQACGTPIIAYGNGGILDTVHENISGIFFAEQTKESLVEAIHRFYKQAFAADQVRDHARQFSSTTFTNRLKTIIDKLR